MKKLDAARRTEIERLAAAIAAKADEIQAAYDEAEVAVKAAFAPLAAEVASYNAIVREWNELVEGWQDDASTYYDGQSEKWQESEKGEAYSLWFNRLDEQRLDELDEPEAMLDEPDPVRIEDLPPFEPDGQ